VVMFAAAALLELYWLALLPTLDHMLALDITWRVLIVLVIVATRGMSRSRNRAR
jgi:hypothetical protein